MECIRTIHLTSKISGTNKSRRRSLYMSNKGINPPMKMRNLIQIRDPPVTKKSHSLFLTRCSLHCAPIMECPRNKYQKQWIYITIQTRLERKRQSLANFHKLYIILSDFNCCYYYWRQFKLQV